MGQEAGKSAWPKPAGGYQTITGRRYGRRHAYVSFRPSLTRHKTASKDDHMDWQEMEMDSVNGESSISSKGNISSMLQAIFPVSSNMVHPETKLNAEAPGRTQADSLKGAEPSAFSYKKLKGGQAADCDAEHLFGSKKSSEACAWPTLEDEDNPSSPSVLSFVNIDSYEPESSDGEEDELSADPSLGLQRRLDDMICELGKEFDYLSGLHSYLCAKSPGGSSSEGDGEEPDGAPGRGSPRADEDGARPSNAVSDGPEEPEGSLAGVSPVGQESADRESDPAATEAEMVVRPKVRKQSSESQLEKRKCSQPEAGRGSRQLAGSKCGSAPPFFLTQTGRPREFLFDFPQTACSVCESTPLEGKREDAETGRRPKAGNQDDLWEDLEDFNEKCASLMKGDDSSECSEGEWSASWTSDSGAEKEPCSSDGSWETLPGCLDEPQAELPSNGSSPDDAAAGLNLVPEDQTPLEEGEIPWLSYQEETDSSSDEEPEGASHFVHPGLFMLDGNNNFEDDSSASEDLDADWRLLDDFGEGGMAQAISYVDPQLLAYMALEERLAEAMEAALAHLESLAIDVEQAHPPATEDIIDCLPQITVQEEHYGQEQCCAICCCEYVKDEIATELPCHHIFHKLCVTLWLRKSGTCPVCRHVLSPALPDAPVPASFVPDHDAPPSNHSAAGTR
ncbi:E3 ubiquitin-protein ligase Praja-2 [Megalops cyprinoides]|uniref:E3 ubiquitin-protein ligase Praja-2 n=1 Tax=Megalops cyprinoides TaxID=118141 RepID=UPI001864F245|nr:E3 ubiquitin-protein ligase Praja-2 [Megalops cyprinoides]XP_036385028.1 E3 ubiquitin-protein ligase Praja-2 [Megalops cyprinoides]XP_036385029.1 E3 ubiquitin-protein ligase Praja-2 [Megalops cyprinoides]